MNFKIIEKEKFYLVGKHIQTTSENGANHVEIPEFWQTAGTDGTVSKVFQVPGIKALVGACIMEDPSVNTFKYGICALVDEKPVEALELQVTEVGASHWAVFESIGPMPHAIQKVWQQIFSEWFPTSGYVHGNGPELEVYPEGDTSSETYYAEVWIPIVQK